MKRSSLTVLSIVAITVCIVASWYFYLCHSFSARIRWKLGSICAARKPCMLHLDDIFPGEWDRMLVFDMAASQQEIQVATGQRIRKPDLERLIVLMRGPDVIRTMTEEEGFERPLAGEVLFEHVSVVQNHITIDRRSNFAVEQGSESCNKCVTLLLQSNGDAYLIP